MCVKVFHEMKSTWTVAAGAVGAAAAASGAGAGCEYVCLAFKVAPTRNGFAVLLSLNASLNASYQNVLLKFNAVQGEQREREGDEPLQID